MALRLGWHYRADVQQTVNVAAGDGQQLVGANQVAWHPGVLVAVPDLHQDGEDLGLLGGLDRGLLDRWLLGRLLGRSRLLVRRRGLGFIAHRVLLG
jgi:hypothetical protein